MKIVTAAALAGALLAAPLGAAAKIAAPSGAYTLDPTHANIVFQVSHAGLSPYTARFDEFDATLTLDVDDPSKSAVTATVKTGSVNVNYRGEKAFQEKLAYDKKFLNGKTHPEITFTSTKVDVTGEKTATISGDLTMLGVTKPITLDATLTGALAEHPFAGKKPAVGFTANGVIDRTEWGFTHLANTMPGLEGLPIVGPEVTIMIQAEFVKAD